MQSLNNFTNFELNTEDTINVNGGRGRIHGRFGKANIRFIYGTKMPVSTKFSDYASFDFTGFETETITKETTQPEFTSDQLAPDQVIL